MRDERRTTHVDSMARWRTFWFFIVYRVYVLVCYF